MMRDTRDTDKEIVRMRDTGDRDKDIGMMREIRGIETGI